MQILAEEMDETTRKRKIGTIPLLSYGSTEEKDLFERLLKLKVC